MNIDMHKTIARINELAAKKKSGQPLTKEEIAERKELYKIYLSVIRGNLANQLDNLEVIEEDPNKSGEFKTVWQGKNIQESTNEAINNKTEKQTH